MSRKNKESPLNLIRILPPKEGTSPSHRYNPASPHFKLKLDGEEAPRPWISLGGLVDFFEMLLRAIGNIGAWTLRPVKRVIHGCTQGIAGIGEMAKSLSEQIRKPPKRPGGGVHFPGRPVRTEMTQGKPYVSEIVQRERNKQREMLIEEVHALRTQLTHHQDELIRVTAQMEELKALVSSQQQVLLHLGKELEAAERHDSSSENPPIKKTNLRRSKLSQPDQSESSDPLPPTQFEFGPPHH